jgi:hypothetical protein
MDSPPVEHRPFRRWVILWMAWVIGLAIWAVYLGMIAVLLYRWLGS